MGEQSRFEHSSRAGWCRCRQRELRPMSEADELRAQLAQCQEELLESKAEYEEFHTESKELEGLITSDLEEMEAKYNKERTAREKAQSETRMLQERFSKETRDLGSEMEALKCELMSQREQNSGLLTARQHLEQECDDLERKERAIEAVAADSTSKLEEILEQKILLEQDMAELEENNVEQHQRLKDEIRDLTDELEATRRKVGSPRSSKTSPMLSPIPSAATTSPLSTRGLVVIGDMLKRVKDMEERLAGCRSSLGQMLSSREGTPRSSRTTPHSPTKIGKGVIVPSLKL